MSNCLLIRCPDRPGIVAAVTGLLHRRGCNITTLDEHATQARGGTLFMRVVFEAEGGALDGFDEAFAGEVAGPLDMRWRRSDLQRRPRVAILASKQEHALLELLWRWRSGRLPCEVACVVSNHLDVGTWVSQFGVPFHHVPVEAGRKPEAEARIEELVGGADLVVLARYMQILTGDFVSRFPDRIINIHHSFLPAFAGADPYRQAYDRGVKLIGATAHYVTAQLDEGPIIEQDVVRVSHRQGAEELRALGVDLERQVLARAVRWHLEDRILVDGRRTVVFV